MSIPAFSAIRNTLKPLAGEIQYFGVIVKVDGDIHGDSLC